jgi:hypothetical protein
MAALSADFADYADQEAIKATNAAGNFRPSEFYAFIRVHPRPIQPSGGIRNTE